MWREPPYSTAPRSPSSRASELSERLPPRAVPGPPTQLLLPEPAAAAAASTSPAAAASTAGSRQTRAQGPLRSGVSAAPQREIDRGTRGSMSWLSGMFEKTCGILQRDGLSEKYEVLKGAAADDARGFFFFFCPSDRPNVTHTLRQVIQPVNPRFQVPYSSHFNLYSSSWAPVERPHTVKQFHRSPGKQHI